ncbi:MAG TPA: hypothetical protein ENN81_11170 [Phycisphaerales bacterium]|nr:hypothetical protein [Phycisphaerales bacterium]
MDKLHAVLTGDIVRSRSLSHRQLEKVRNRLDWCTEQLNGLKRRLVHGRVDFFRGDSWQMLLNEPTQALRAALYARAALLAFEECTTRISIGIGPVTEISRRRISQSTGKAFVLSGHALDQMKPGERLAIELPDAWRETSAWLKVMLRMCDAVAGHWKPRQAEAALRALEGLTQTEIADAIKPPISQQAVAKALAGGDWNAIDAALAQFEVAVGALPTKAAKRSTT